MHSCSTKWVPNYMCCSQNPIGFCSQGNDAYGAGRGFGRGMGGRMMPGRGFGNFLIFLSYLAVHCFCS